MAATSAQGEDRLHGPTYWFVKFDLALEEGDWSAAAQAAGELRQRGIDMRVRLGRVRPKAPEAVPC
jgi:hypothetical protein